MSSVQNIKIEPVDVRWANPEMTKVTCLADVADSLSGTSFLLNSLLDAVGYYVWYDTGASTDPAPAGKTAAVVSITTGDSAALVASKTVAVLDALGDFNAKVLADDPASFNVETVGYGATTPSADVDTLFTFVEVLVGGVFDLGFTDGDVEVGLSEDLFDVVTHQLGTTVVDKIRTGINLEPISIVMKESDAAKIQQLLGEGSGANVTPAGGTELTGLGSDKKFTNISSQARRMILHPVRNASNDPSDDYVFWRTYPTITGMVFSGEADHKITVEFQVLPNELILEEVEFFGKGDHTQNFLR